MMLRDKSIRRLKLFLIALVSLALLGAGAYVFRARQLERRAVAKRAQGLVDLEAGDYFNAMHNLGSYVQRHPEDAETLFSYGQARENVDEPNGRNIGEAIRIYRRVLDLKHDDPKASEALLTLYQKCGFDTESIALADAILRASPSDSRACIAKATSLTRLRKYDEALKALAPRFKADPVDLPAHQLGLFIMRKANRPPEALSAHAAAVRKAHPDAAVADLIDSMVAALLEKPADARAAALKAASKNNLDAEMTLAIARQLDGLECGADAVALLNRSAATLKNAAIERALVTHLFESGKFAEAVKQAADSKDPETIAVKCLALLRLERHEEAASVARALASAPSDAGARVWSKVLDLALRSAAPQEVITGCTEALKVLPAQAEIHAMLAEAYLSAGETEAALRSWQDAARAAPAWSEPLTRLSRIYARGGRVDEAIAAAQLARRRAPHDVEAMLSLAYAWSAAVRAGNGQVATPLLALTEEIRKAAPDEHQILPIRVFLLSRTNQRDAAVAELKSVLAMKAPPAESVLLDLAAISREANLGLTADLLDLSERAHGITADLTFVRARQLFDAGHGDQGRALLDDQRKKATGDAEKWGTAWARYLDLTKDPRAHDEWVSLADRFPQSTNLQWLAISAPAVQQDRDFIGRILERLRTQVGDTGLTWRLARAQYLLQNQGSNKDAVEAALILNEVSRTAPDLLAPRLLLATCLERLGNISGAIEQLSIARNLQPNSSPLRLELARLYQERQDYTQAHAELEPFTQGRINATPEQCRSAALLLARQGETDTALKLLETTTNVNDLPPDLALAMIYRRRRENDKVDAILSKLLAGKDLQIPVIGFAADYYAATARPQLAEAALAKADAVKAAPGKKEILRGDYFNTHGRGEEALAQYQAATQAAPEDASTWRQLATFYFARGRIDEAVATLEKATKALPDDKSFQAALHEAPQIASVGEQDRGFAVSMVLWLLQNPSDQPAISEAISASVAAAKDPAAGARLASTLRQAADRSPRVLPLQVFASFRCLAAGRNDDAIAIAMRAMETAPAAPQPAQFAASALAAAGRWAEVPAAADKWKSRDPDHAMAADVLWAMGSINSGDPAAAMQRLQPYVDKLSSDADLVQPAIYQYATAQLVSGKSADAQKLLRPLLDRGPQWRIDWIRLAVAANKDPAASDAWLAEVEPHIPADAFNERLALLEASQALSQSHPSPARTTRVQGLLASLERQAQSKGSAEAMLSLGCIREAQGDLAGAESSYRASLKLKPDLDIARNNLAMLLAQHGGRLDEALSLAREAVKSSDPNRASFYDTLALVCSLRKEFPAAVEAIEQALKLRPDDLKFQMRLATILVDSRQLDRASGVVDQLKALQKVRPFPADFASELQSLQDRLSKGKTTAASAS